MRELDELRELLSPGSAMSQGLNQLLSLAGGNAVIQFEDQGEYLRIPECPCDFQASYPLGELGGTLTGELLAGEDGRPWESWANAITHLVRAALECREDQQTEDEGLQNLLDRLSLTHDLVGIGTWEYLMETREVTWSEQHLRLYGLDPESVPRTHQEWLELIHPEDRDFVENHVELACQYREPYEAEFRIIWSDGSQRWLMSRGLVMHGHNGRPVKMTGLSMDITAQKQVESELRESEERYRMLADHIDDVVSLHDLQGAYLYVSPSFSKLSGYPAERTTGSHPFQFVHPDDRPQLGAAFTACAAGSPATAHWRGARRDGSSLWMETRMTRVQDDEGRTMHVLCVSRDVTERLLLEEQLRQSQKMDAVGKLAGGIAHDFNNLLTVINGYAELVLSQSDTTEPQRPHLRHIHDAGLRAASLTQQLLAFSRKQMLQPKIVTLNSVVQSVMPLLERLIPKNIHIGIELDLELQPVKADPTQLEQVVMNLVLNARDAMPDGGRLVITTRADDCLSQSSGMQADLPPGRYACLTVLDTGCGMADDTKNRIFEPFYTTKQPGKGTGLGLSTAYGIIKQSGGDIWVNSELRVGSSFSVALPIVQPEQVEETPPVSQTEEPSRGSLTVLLAEDDDRVREFTSDILRRYGFEVIEAADGASAWRSYLYHAERIDILITDMVMPHVSGRRLAEQILLRRPSLPVLFLSGYPDGLNGEVTDSDIKLLAKPFTPQLLAAAIREALQPRAARAAQG